MTYKVESLKGVKNDWYHKWCKLMNTKLYECVKGPLRTPMVTIPFSYISDENNKGNQCECNRRNDGCYNKPGIPDPWEEYLILKREAEKGNDLTFDFPKRDLDVTTALSQGYRVYFGQGIPDPWKQWKVVTDGRQESNFEELKRDFKNYVTQLRSGPGYDMYSAEKACCPHCDKKLLVLCPRKEFSMSGLIEESKGLHSKHEENMKDESVLANVECQMDERVSEERRILKDVCVETDNLCEEREGLAQVVCTCKTDRYHGCGSQRLCSSCPVCTSSTKEQREKRVKCVNIDQLRCLCGGRHDRDESVSEQVTFESHREGFADRLGKPCRCHPHGRCVMDRRHKHFTIPSPREMFPVDPNQRSILPFFYNSNPCQCPPQQFIGFEEKNDHCLELHLVCLKCEKKRHKKKKKKVKLHKSSKQGGHRDGECIPCLCKNRPNESPPCFCNLEDANEGKKKEPPIDTTKFALYDSTRCLSPRDSDHKPEPENRVFSIDRTAGSHMQVGNHAVYHDPIRYTCYNDADNPSCIIKDTDVDDSGETAQQSQMPQQPVPKPKLTHWASSEFNKYIQRNKSDKNLHYDPNKDWMNNSYGNYESATKVVSFNPHRSKKSGDPHLKKLSSHKGVHAQQSSGNEFQQKRKNPFRKHRQSTVLTNDLNQLPTNSAKHEMEKDKPGHSKPRTSFAIQDRKQFNVLGHIRRKPIRKRDTSRGSVHK